MLIHQSGLHTRWDSQLHSATSAQHEYNDETDPTMFRHKSILLDYIGLGDVMPSVTGGNMPPF